eukprot:c18234_g1_i1.p1 GENE.c18234_g1_i1~~c18234_g1_i1.p1  ORF type:complete len:253 (+),score=68.98 c18234_g1_i1:42-800(+)
MTEMTFGDFVEQNKHFQKLESLIPPTTPISLLLTMDEDELVANSPPELKILMKMLTRALFESTKKFSKQEIFGHDPTTLIFNNKICSTLVHGLQGSGKTPIDALARSIAQQDPPLQGIIKIDLSWCGLVDIDVGYIKQIVDVIKPQTLDLSGNRIHGYSGKVQHLTPENNPVDKDILYLLENLTFLIISANPFASIDRLDFFQYIQQNKPDYLKKLIWIPNGTWLLAGAWKVMISPEHQDTVIQTHKQFFKI